MGLLYMYVEGIDVVFFSLPAPKVITWHLYSSLNIYILIFFSETIGTIWTKLSKNVHWIVPYKFYGFFVVHKRNKMLKCAKKGVSIYLGINYLMFICFYVIFSSPCQRQCEFLPSLGIRHLSSVNFSHFNLLPWNRLAKWTEMW